MWWSSCLASAGVFFLDFLCGGIISCLSAETTVGANVGGPKIGWEPGTQNSRTNTRKLVKVRGQGFPESLTSSQKLWIPLHVPSNPFYREAKGLLHSKITIESKEYSKCEHIQECLLHLVICMKFTNLQADHHFTPWNRTFEAKPFTWSSLVHRPFIHENRQ
jgi:hypothetical protein